MNIKDLQKIMIDFIGTEVAFAVFQKRQAKVKSQLTIENINKDKLFFLSFANVIKTHV